jgi:glycosyltransferase involved in cell wall biosynthesis
MYNLLSLILPVYNQADHIHSVVNEYSEALKKIPLAYEFILVVNGCRDNSLIECQKLQKEFANIQVIHSVKGGWGLAVKLGLQNAKGDLFCYTNSARTSPKDLALLLLYAIANPNVVIKANRRIRENFIRRFGSLLYNLECRLLFDLSYWDINGTPKVFPRNFTRLLNLSKDDDLIDLEFNIICRKEDYPILEVPIFSSKRHGGESTTNIKSALRLYTKAFRMWQATRLGQK